MNIDEINENEELTRPEDEINPPRTESFSTPDPSPEVPSVSNVNSSWQQNRLDLTKVKNEYTQSTNYKDLVRGE